MSDANSAMVRKFWNSINQRDVEGYLSTFTGDAVAYDPVSGPPLRTNEERRAFMDGLLSGFAELEATIDFMTACGDSTAVKWTVRAKTPTGDDVHLEGIDTYDHAPDGRLREMRGYFQM